jgi:hypothetical protein
MKRTAFFWVFLFCFVFSSAQTHLFFNTGLNCAFLQQSKVVYEEVSFEPGFSGTFAAGVRFSFTDRVGLSAGVNYTAYKSMVDQLWGSAGASGTTTYGLYLRYCRLSSQAEYYFGHGKNLFVGLGPFFSVLTSAKIKGTWDGRRADGYIIHSELDKSLYDELRHFDLGLAGSIGIKLRIGKGFSLSPQIGASHSLIALRKMDDPHGGSTLTMHYQGNHLSAVCFLIEMNIKVKSKAK